jgi:hypothetical protein
MNEHTEQIVRTIVIAVLFLALGAAWIWGMLPEGTAERAEGMLLLLAPALLDALRVFGRQRKVRHESLRPPPGPG